MPARAQAPHEIGSPRISEARLTARGLAAMAVMNITEEMQLVWKQVFVTYAPIFFSVPLAGSLPQARQRALARGNKMPPAIHALLPGLLKNESLSICESVGIMEQSSMQKLRW